jgi:hypothetical protein
MISGLPWKNSHSDLSYFLCLSFPISDLRFGVRLTVCMGRARGVILLRADTTGTFLHGHGVFDKTCMARGPYFWACHTYSGTGSMAPRRSLFGINQ